MPEQPSPALASGEAVYGRISAIFPTMCHVVVKRSTLARPETLEIPATSTPLWIVDPDEYHEMPLGIYLRRSVVINEVGAAMTYGQVVGYNAQHHELSVNSQYGVLHVRFELCRLVHPLLAMLLWNTAYACTENAIATMKDLEQIMLQRVFGNLQERVDATMSIGDVLANVKTTVDDVNPNRTVSWCSPYTGVIQACRVQHAVRFVFAENNPLDQERRRSLEATMFDDPQFREVDNERPVPRGEVDFMDPNMPYRPEQLVPAAVAVQQATLQGLHNRLVNDPPARMLPVDAIGLNERLASNLLSDLLGDTPRNVFKPGKYGYDPSPDDILLFRAMFGPEHHGKQPNKFAKQIQRAPDLRFAAYPGLVTRLLSTEFGAGNLSIAHFLPMSDEAIDKLLTASATNMINFGVNAPLPRASMVTSIEDLEASVVNLQRFYATYGSFVSQSFVAQVYSFVNTARFTMCFSAGHLKALVKWVDLCFQRFNTELSQDVQEHDVDVNGKRHLEVSKYLSLTHPDITVMFSNETTKIMLKEARNLDADGKAPPKKRKKAATASGAGSKDAKHVKKEETSVPQWKREVPTHNGRPVCLRHLSVNGCDSKSNKKCVFDTMVHHVPKRNALTPGVLSAIQRLWGGVSSKYPHLRE
ncbi:hypothetical protein SPRG_16652 [Saprolegnia parasitica CBS 223.65]|uniref:Uncharacterized protein n=1 Tax=Saprolegnia parasitica (strain CBS 223.65) TaxID=695850 RepID=A0A067BMH0_SAPPC|nr:hypothetical protein SPRG_16652 [Saprolegnia parasitica CBS 223.65]KDO17940.1 hypothetical protein SPRG_16652 [Saprolegnia parasitica CBS 223.65]|eukprot:XP_012211352.1 hypothetical protein SPRG_16652 [Saprolegnia parasitica CBS 223.65]